MVLGSLLLNFYTLPLLSVIILFPLNQFNYNSPFYIPKCIILLKNYIQVKFPSNNRSMIVLLFVVFTSCATNTIFFKIFTLHKHQISVCCFQHQQVTPLARLQLPLEMLLLSYFNPPEIGELQIMIFVLFNAALCLMLIQVFNSFTSLSMNPYTIWSLSPVCPKTNYVPLLLWFPNYTIKESRQPRILVHYFFFLYRPQLTP